MGLAHEISVLVRKESRVLCPLNEDTARKSSVFEPERGPSSDTESADTLSGPPELREINVCCVSHPSLCILLLQLEINKIV